MTLRISEKNAVFLASNPDMGYPAGVGPKGIADAKVTQFPGSVYSVVPVNRYVRFVQCMDGANRGAFELVELSPGEVSNEPD